MGKEQKETSLTDQVLLEDEKLCSKATDGPWHDDANEIGDTELFGPVFILGDKGKIAVCGNIDEPWDGTFIARARTALPLYIAEVRRLREENELLCSTVDAGLRLRRYVKRMNFYPSA
jgi:hypothetical protein